jgi:hypothetical protein
MRAKGFTPAVLAGLGIATAIMAQPAAAQGRGSMEDQMACTPDVYRLCSSYVPDEDAIVACLKRNVNVLSRACHQVFTRPETPGTANQDDD